MLTFQTEEGDGCVMGITGKSQTAHTDNFALHYLGPQGLKESLFFASLHLYVYFWSFCVIMFFTHVSMMMSIKPIWAGLTLQMEVGNNQ